LLTHALLIAAVATGILFGVFYGLGIYTHHNEAVVVPDVKGLTVDEAAGFLASKKLRFNVIDSIATGSVPPGTVAEMIPSSGAKVKEGRIVFLTVHSPSARLKGVPDVSDLSVREAEELLKSMEFYATQRKYVPGDYRDLVIGLELGGRLLESGERVLPGAAINLLVEDGRGKLPEETSTDSLAETEESLPNFF
jgi:beta-lactam-binding protein with PASTA domain